MKTSFRKLNLDILRIIACFFVIYQHTSDPIIEQTVWNNTRSLALIILYFSKTAVPLFLAISGACLIKKDNSIKSSLIKAFHFTIILFVFSLIYYGFYNKNINLQNFLYTALGDKTTPALWYMYLYIAILLMLPILSKIKLQEKEYWYLLILYFVIIGIPNFICNFYALPNLSMYFKMSFFSTFIICFLLGHFFENVLKNYTPGGMIIAVLILFFNVAFTHYCIHREYLSTGSNNIEAVFNINALAPTIAITFSIFYIAKYIEIKKPIHNLQIKQFVSYIGKCTFGIYLFSDLLINVLPKHSFSNLLLTTIIFDVEIFITGLIITSVLQLIPILKKLVG